MSTAQFHGRAAGGAGWHGRDVVGWLVACDEAWRSWITHVTLDMSSVYKSAIRQALPHAALAVDPFHLSQLANKTVADVRRRVTFEHHGRRGRADDLEYKIKGMLVRGAEKLTPAARQKLLCALADLGDGGCEIRAAWQAKELLRDVLKLSPARTGRATCRSEVSAALTRFFAYCATTGAAVPEVVTLAEKISKWRDEIATAVLHGLSNAASEGINRLIRLVYRIAFGMTNVGNQLRRARYVASRKTRPLWLQSVTVNRELPVAA